MQIIEYLIMSEFPEMDLQINEEIKRTARLNERLKSGVPLYDLLTDIRAYKKPVVIDLNNTLVNEEIPYTVNPDADESLNNLRKIGTIFIVTTSYNWEQQQKALKDCGLWKDDLILVVWPNYAFTNKYDPNWAEYEDSSAHHDPKTASIVDDYLKTNSVGKSFTPDDFFARGPLEKALAPVFNKPWNVPIIDDAVQATMNNPGMLGLMVKQFPLRKDQNEVSLPTLSQASQQVVEYYQKIDTDKI